MTKQELEAALKQLIQRAPRPESIDTTGKAQAFKKAVDGAKKAKSLEKLQSAYNELRSYYA